MPDENFSLGAINLSEILLKSISIIIFVYPNKNSYDWLHVELI
jgi:hypothetical protein